ncbi:DUF3450 domain-containing protein [Sulfurimonas sp. MAG313]|nr:DUF3450 domain-containing protein [Sulfurimonas sp. MAG313]MDF1880021.1 DUF3450 domain-containing protein [Sulfurimonas sp. MAG313]
MKNVHILALCCLSFSLHANSVDSAIDKTNLANKKSESSQKKINTYAEKSETIYDEYSRLQKELKQQEAYNKQLRSIVQRQVEEIPKLNEQLKQIEVTNKKIIPLMLEMVDKLEKFVSIDTPFLKEERRKRVKNLKNFLTNPDLNTAELFRMILESYKIEYSYARTLEVYRSELSEGDNTKIVDFLRVGRLALYYQSLDGLETALYDVNTQDWILLDSDYNEKIKKSIKMARKKVSPDFLTLAIVPTKAEK